MRRVIILALLYVGVQLILPLGRVGGGSEALLTFGFLILAAYTVGELTTVVGLPKIVGYMFAGMLFGPSALAAISTSAVGRLTPVSDLAIALIAFLAGVELRWSDLRSTIGKLTKILSVEMLLSIIAVAASLFALRGWVPYLAEAPTSRVVAFIVMFTAIAIAHSPSVTVALLSETGARGTVAKTTLGIVLLSDVVVVLLFTLAQAVARGIAPPSGMATAASPLLVAWEIGGSLVVGAALGGCVALYLRFVHRELMLFTMLLTFFGAALARVAHVETLLMLMTAGFVAENVSHSERSDAMRHALERSAAPVFVVFFALAGAQIAIREVIAVLPVVLPIALARAVAIWLGCRLGARWARAELVEQRYTWMGLVSQAGVAIGLVALVSGLYPEAGSQMRTLLLSLIAVNQIIGPILFRRALVASGEVPGAERAAAAPGLAEIGVRVK
ncbi:MAG TPA: cation:proton antiporter [Gemmatimonadaceae bacterium]|jgi:Kef-type K+ transport system membrane component KefB|nr:cation:proton antiporter [Gemmatimonadaceae bacterium]